jgi:hypothetical protein
MNSAGARENTLDPANRSGADNACSSVRSAFFLNIVRPSSILSGNNTAELA